MPVGAGIGAAGRTSADREADPEAVREAELAARRAELETAAQAGELAHWASVRRQQVLPRHCLCFHQMAV